jgi:hypothetical protein
MPRAQRLLSPVAIAAIALAGPAALSTAPAAASTTQEAVFQDDVQLKADPAGTLLTMQELGVQRVRVFVTWADVAPSPMSKRKPSHFNATDPNAYSAAKWRVYDDIVQDAQADGLKLDFTISGGAPLWATGAGAPNGGPHPSWRPSPHEFQSFVRAVGTRYSGSFIPNGATTALPGVDYWAIWNEPNYGPDLAPQATPGLVEIAPAVYRGLLDAAWTGLHQSGHGSDTIVIGETAPRGHWGGGLPGNFDGIKPMRFVRALYCVGDNLRPLRGAAAAARGCPTNAAGSAGFRSAHPALFSATAFAVHPYSQGLPPTTSTKAIGHNIAPGFDSDFVDFPAIGRFERVLDRLGRAYGSHRQLPIISTEYGYVSGTSISLNPTVAAYYMNWAEYLSWKQPRLWTYAQYLLVDSVIGNFNSGLETISTKHKATYAAYRLPIYMPSTTGRSGQNLEVWGDIRPSVNYGSPTVTLQFQTPGGSFQTLTTITSTNRSGYFDTHVTFPQSGNARLAWTYPSGPLSGATIYSRTVQVTEK